MLKIILIGFAIIAVNVILQAWATTYWLKRTLHFTTKWNDGLTTFRILYLLVFSFLFLTLLHVVHALMWGFAIQIIPIVEHDFNSFLDIVYYSLVTFTTLGYGDLTINSEWKLLSGIEAINGVMLIGWSTALMYSLIQNIFRSIKENNG